MVVKEDIPALLLDACPSFTLVWEHYREEEGEERLIYPLLGEFARHLVALYQQKRLVEFAAIFALIERLQVEGDGYVQEAAVIGLLEGLQNVALNTRLDPDVFRPFLLPESLRGWDELIRFWHGGSDVYRESLLALRLQGQDASCDTSARPDKNVARSFPQ
jgi:hypothetical protein